MTAHKNRHNRKGAALVEMALVLPLFAMIVLGIVEFGRALMVGQLLTTAARDGTRLAVVDGSSNAEVIQAVKDFVQSTVGIDPNAIGVTVTVTPATGNPPAADVADALPRDLCQVTVQIPFDQVSLTVSNYLDGKQLAGHCAMRHE